MYDDDFLQALGTWQRGWLEEPSKRAALAAELERQAAKLPERGRQVDQKCYRKRFLYKGDLTSIIVHGALDEGHTSWTLNRVYAQEFKGYHRDEAVTAAVFAHTPTPDEVLLNIVALWEDPTFRTALDDYVRRARPNADALLNFRANQGEVILKAPLRGDEIIGLTGIGAALDEICDRLGIIQAARPSIYRDLMGVEIYPGEPTWVWDDNAKGVFVRVREKFLGSRR